MVVSIGWMPAWTIGVTRLVTVDLGSDTPEHTPTVLAAGSSAATAGWGAANIATIGVMPAVP